MELSDLQEAVLNFVDRPNYQPVKPKVIARKLGLEPEQAPELRKAIKKLVRSGHLAYGASHRVFKPEKPPEPKADQVAGRFRRTSAGFGFVRPQNAPPGHEREDDIFISERGAEDASSGDLVLVELSGTRHKHRGNPTGRIVQVLERSSKHFVGTYFTAEGQAYVRVDGTVFAEPIWVGDAGAKNARPEDKVVIEMVCYPSNVARGEGVIIEVLGERGAPKVDTETVIREFDLPTEFAEDSLENARQAAAKFEQEIEQAFPPDRLDLTEETIITIDPVDARDFDDAISLHRLENGHWRLGVHIADVSHFVQQGSPLDREAKQRGTSVYLPDRVIPMLPELISNGLASLQPEKIRFTKTAFIEFSAEGTPIATDLHHAAIRSSRRFTYEEVDEFLQDPENFRDQCSEKVHSLLGRMRDLARILKQRRFERGALEIHMPDVKVDLDEAGNVCGAHFEENTESHQIIEEFMLAANEAVARHLEDEDFPFLRRIHAIPDERKMKLLTEFVRELGFNVENLQNRFELQELLNHVAKLPQSHAVNYAVLRSLQRAIYSPREEGHYALASESYTHFTSPIRRYPDLTIHRAVSELLAGRSPEIFDEQLELLGEHCTDCEQRAEDAERTLKKLKLLNYLKDRIGLELDGTITGVEDFGFFVEGKELPAEGLVPVRTLEDDYYRYDRHTHTLMGHREDNLFRLGDAVRVKVDTVDLDRRELNFRLVSHQPQPPVKPEKSEPQGDFYPPEPRKKREKRPNRDAVARKTKNAEKKSKPNRGKGKRKRR